MRVVLCSVAGALLGMPAMADVISYGGQDYVTIDWGNTPVFEGEGFGAYGYAGGIEVFFQSVGLESTETTTYDYSSDFAFDNVSYGNGMIGSLTIFGGQDGMSSLQFSSNVGDVLIMIGAPDDNLNTTQFGASQWEFQDDSIEMEVVDSEATFNGFQMNDNVFNSPSGTQISGILGASGDFSVLEWMQSSLNGPDRMQITFAVVLPTVPAPAGGLVLLIPAAMFGRRRR